MKTCECGCGGQTRPYARNRHKRGHVRDEFARFLPGHTGRRRAERTPAGDGYTKVLHDGEHQRKHKDGYVLEHLIVAGRALGRPVLLPNEVHHVNGDRGDNRPCNLVICENHAYHELLHVRQRALDACGHANWLLCCMCGKYDDPSRLHVIPHKTQYHRECSRDRARARRRARGAAPQPTRLATHRCETCGLVTYGGAGRAAHSRYHRRQEAAGMVDPSSGSCLDDRADAPARHVALSL